MNRYYLKPKGSDDRLSGYAIIIKQVGGALVVPHKGKPETACFVPKKELERYEYTEEEKYVLERKEIKALFQIAEAKLFLYRNPLGLQQIFTH